MLKAAGIQFITNRCTPVPNTAQNVHIQMTNITNCYLSGSTYFLGGWYNLMSLSNYENLMQGMKAVFQCTGSQEGYPEVDKSNIEKKKR